MTTYTKTSPVGLDSWINSLQTKLHTRLLANLSLLTAQVDVFGRCYRISEDETISPAKFISKEYDKSLFSTDKAVVGWFYERGERGYNNGIYTVAVGNIFHVNLKTAYASTTHRADMEFVKEITGFYSIEPYGFRLVDYVSGIDNVYSDFNLEKKEVEDMHPYLVLRFDLNKTFRV